MAKYLINQKNILALPWLLKTNTYYKMFVCLFVYMFVCFCSLCNSMTFEFWFILEFLRRHDNLKPKRFELHRIQAN